VIITRRRGGSALVVAAAIVASLAVTLSAQPARATTPPPAGSWVAQPTLVVLGNTTIPARGTVSFAVTGVPAGATAALHVVVASSQTTGWLAAYPQGGSSNASVVNYVVGQQPSGLALVQVSGTGTVTLANHSNGWVRVNADRTGYYVGGAPSAVPGAFVPIPTTVVLGNTTIGSYRSVTFHVPAPAGSTVALHGVVASSATSGWLAAYPGGGSSNVSFLNYVHGQQLSNLTLVQVGAGGEVVIANHSSGSVVVNADVQGYYVAGAPLQAHTFVTLPATAAFDTRKAGGAIPSYGTRSFRIAGLLGIPVGATVALHVVIASSTGNGWVAAYPDNGSSNASVVNYTRGQQASNLTFVTVGSGGAVTIANHSSGSVQVAADVTGYHRTTNGSPGHYVRNLTGTAASDAATMHSEGASDAAAGATFVLLHIGAQLNDKSGVQLSATSTNLTYAQLVAALQAYLDGFGTVPNATVAVATNNDANDWTNYPAAQRGADWADKVVDLLTPGAGVSVVGADDIEGGFFSTEAQAEAWESAYVAAASNQKLIYVGSADGCPTSYPSSTACSYGWTLAQYYKLAGGLNPTHVQALPQIYVTAQATQWANIDHAGGGALSVLGSLTESGACGTACSLTPDEAWAALHDALAKVPAAPGTLEVDLRVN
jgi:hypothetical protein